MLCLKDIFLVTGSSLTSFILAALKRAKRWDPCNPPVFEWECPGPEFIQVSVREEYCCARYWHTWGYTCTDWCIRIKYVNQRDPKCKETVRYVAVC